jgi:hypothetical protein
LGRRSRSVSGAERPARELLQRQLAPRRRLLDTRHQFSGERRHDRCRGRTTAAADFGNIDAIYTQTFATFSAQRLFTSIGSTFTDVNFFLPGTITPR